MDLAARRRAVVNSFFSKLNDYKKLAVSVQGQINSLSASLDGKVTKNAEYDVSCVYDNIVNRQVSEIVEKVLPPVAERKVLPTQIIERKSVQSTKPAAVHSLANKSVWKKKKKVPKREWYFHHRRRRRQTTQPLVIQGKLKIKPLLPRPAEEIEVVEPVEETKFASATFHTSPAKPFDNGNIFDSFSSMESAPMPVTRFPEEPTPTLKPSKWQRVHPRKVCGVCGLQISSRHLTKHMATLHSCSLCVECPVCSADVKRTSFIMHVRMKHPEIRTLSCAQCGKVYSYFYILLHIYKDHELMSNNSIQQENVQ